MRDGVGLQRGTRHTPDQSRILSRAAAAAAVGVCVQVVLLMTAGVQVDRRCQQRVRHTCRCLKLSVSHAAPNQTTKVSHVLGLQINIFSTSGQGYLMKY